MYLFLCFKIFLFHTWKHLVATPSSVLGNHCELSDIERRLVAQSPLKYFSSQKSQIYVNISTRCKNSKFLLILVPTHLDARILPSYLNNNCFQFTNPENIMSSVYGPISYFREVKNDSDSKQNCGTRIVCQ